jgi:hypothetical protein
MSRALRHIGQVLRLQQAAPVAIDRPHFLFDSECDLPKFDEHQLTVIESPEGIDAPAMSSLEHLNAKNGRLKLDVPHVRDELKVPMRGTVPDEWSLA